MNRFDVASDESFTLRLFLFQFPGWRADVDGTPVTIEVAQPEGFITVPVPAGDHEVVVRFGTTPARTVGWLLSGVGGLALVAMGGEMALPAKTFGVSSQVRTCLRRKPQRSRPTELCA